MQDELLQLLSLVQSGEEDAFSALSEQYAPLIRSMGARYLPSFRAAGDNAVSEQDLEQEARLALYRAALSFDSSQIGVSFGLYAKVCIRNSFVSSLRRLGRGKRTDGAAAARSSRESRRIGLLPDEESDLSERIRAVLSRYESQIFDEYIRGRSVRHISLSVGRSEKSVSNAVYRIRVKIKGLLENNRY